MLLKDRPLKRAKPADCRPATAAPMVCERRRLAVQNIARACLGQGGSECISKSAEIMSGKHGFRDMLIVEITQARFARAMPDPLPSRTP